MACVEGLYGTSGAVYMSLRDRSNYAFWPLKSSLKEGHQLKKVLFFSWNCCILLQNSVFFPLPPGIPEYRKSFRGSYGL